MKSIYHFSAGGVIIIIFFLSSFVAIWWRYWCVMLDIFYLIFNFSRFMYDIIDFNRNKCVEVPWQILSSTRNQPNSSLTCSLLHWFWDQTLCFIKSKLIELRIWVPRKVWLVKAPVFTNWWGISQPHWKHLNDPVATQAWNFICETFRGTLMYYDGGWTDLK